MSKILSKSGDSLADVYDVEGSIAGIDQLNSQEVNLTHDLASSLFSERLSSRVVALTPGAVLQSVEFNSTFDVGNPLTRILGVTVITNGIGGMLNAMVAVTSPLLGFQGLTDAPLFCWDSTEDSVIIQVMIAGVITAQSVLVSSPAVQVPSLAIGDDQPASTAIISFRGATNAFGAGTVTPIALLYLAFPAVEGLSSRGLPIPGW